MNKWWPLALALPAIAGMLWIAGKSSADKKPAAPAHTAAIPEVAAQLPVPVAQPAITPEITAAEAPSAKPSSAAAIASVLMAEPMAMKDLRVLLDKDPEAALATARRDLLWDATGPDAAERTWVVVKALAATGHYEDAKREAALMVRNFHGTKWADDVERHVLAHP